MSISTSIHYIQPIIDLNNPLQQRLPFEKWLYLLTGVDGGNRADLASLLGNNYHTFIEGQTGMGKTELLKLWDYGQVAYFNTTVIHRDTEKLDMISLAPKMPEGTYYLWVPEGIKVKGTTVAKDQIRYFSMFDPRELAWRIEEKAINVITHDYFAGLIESDSYEQIGWFWHEFLQEMKMKQQQIPQRKREFFRQNIVLDEANKLFASEGKAVAFYVSELSKQAAVFAQLVRGLNIIMTLSSHKYRQIKKDIRDEIHCMFTKKVMKNEAVVITAERVDKSSYLKRSLAKRISTLQRDTGEYCYIDMNGDYDFFSNTMLYNDVDVDIDFDLSNFDMRNISTRIIDFLLERKYLFEHKAAARIAYGTALDYEKLPKFSKKEFDYAYTIAYSRYTLMSKVESGETEIASVQLLEQIADLKKKLHSEKRQNKILQGKINRLNERLEVIAKKTVNRDRSELIYHLWASKKYKQYELAALFKITPQGINRVIAAEKKNRERKKIAEKAVESIV